MTGKLKRFLNKEINIQRTTFFIICATFFLGFFTYKSIYADQTAPTLTKKGLQPIPIEHHTKHIDKPFDYWHTLTMGDLVYMFLGIFFLILAIHKKGGIKHKRTNK